METIGHTTRPEEYVKNDWSCPKCGSTTITWRHGTSWAGLWECINCHFSESCNHLKQHTESVEVPYFPTPDIDHSYDQDIQICSTCDQTVPFEEAEPLVGTPGGTGTGEKIHA